MRRRLSALMFIVLGGSALLWLPLTPLTMGGAVLLVFVGLSFIGRR